MKRLFSPRATAAAQVPVTSEQELQITQGLESLRRATAREVMMPRVDVIALAAPVTLGKAIDAIKRSGRSHYPVYRGNLDHLLGVLFVKDLFSLIENGASGASGVTDITALDVTNRLREPYIVPESRSALQILADMRRRRRGFAVVVDEYGGFAGVLTINDLVSELVGDLHDEYDRNPSPGVVRIDQQRYLVDGSCPISDLRNETGVEIPDGEYVTLGGYILDALGHIPAEGESLQRGGWTFTVTQMDRRRVAKVVVERPSTNIAGDGEVRPSTGK